MIYNDVFNGRRSTAMYDIGNKTVFNEVWFENHWALYM